MDRHLPMSPVADPVRRRLLQALPAGVVLLLGLRPRAAAALVAADEVLIEQFDAAGHSTGATRVERVVKSPAQWREQLGARSFEVAREAGTEMPFTGPLWNQHGDGLYRCICCDTPLFDSKTKFDSGTGWPSFWQPISKDNVVESSDSSFGMVRTAVSCRRCDAHLGHVFNDGPQPTGLRYCMNSVSMRFVHRA